MMLTMISGDVYEVVQMFENGTRAIVLEEPGVPVIAVKTAAGWDWLTGEPARPGPELELYNSLLKGTGTTVDVTDPAGNTTTYKDGDS